MDQKATASHLLLLSRIFLADFFARRSGRAEPSARRRESRQSGTKRSTENRVLGCQEAWGDACGSRRRLCPRGSLWPRVLDTAQPAHRNLNFLQVCMPEVGLLEIRRRWRRGTCFVQTLLCHCQAYHLAGHGLGRRHLPRRLWARASQRLGLGSRSLLHILDQRGPTCLSPQGEQLLTSAGQRGSHRCGCHRCR